MLFWFVLLCFASCANVAESRKAKPQIPSAVDERQAQSHMESKNLVSEIVCKDKPNEPRCCPKVISVGLAVRLDDMTDAKRPAVAKAASLAYDTCPTKIRLYGQSKDTAFIDSMNTLQNHPTTFIISVGWDAIIGAKGDASSVLDIYTSYEDIITGIVIGNQPLVSGGSKQKLVTFKDILDAVDSFSISAKQLGLQQAKVIVPFGSAVLGTSSKKLQEPTEITATYEAGIAAGLRDAVANGWMHKLLTLLEDNGGQIGLQFYPSSAASTGQEGFTQLKAFKTEVDDAVKAFGRAGSVTKFQNIPIVITSTGWPINTDGTPTAKAQALNYLTAVDDSDMDAYVEFLDQGALSKGNNLGMVDEDGIAKIEIVKKGAPPTATSCVEGTTWSKTGNDSKGPCTDCKVCTTPATACTVKADTKCAGTTTTSKATTVKKELQTATTTTATTSATGTTTSTPEATTSETPVSDPDDNKANPTSADKSTGTTFQTEVLPVARVLFIFSAIVVWAYHN